MRLFVQVALLASLATAFVPSHNNNHHHRHERQRAPFTAATTGRFAKTSNEDHHQDTTTTTTTRWPMAASPVVVGKSLAAAFLTATLAWTTPTAMESALFNQQQQQQNQPLNIMSRFTTATSSAAQAKEMASGSGSRVNKDPESLLRLGLPINSKEVRKLQGILEDIRIDIGSKRKSAALDGVKKARTILSSKDVDKMKAACREANVCGDIMQSMLKDLDPLQVALRESQDSFQGSEQERTALDKAYAAQKNLAEQLNVLEEQMVPAGYKTPVPEEYSELPQLQGRATIEMTLTKANPGDTFDVSGTTFPTAKLVMVVDGYTSPITAGNFVDLVQKGFYNKMEIQRSDGFVVQTGDPPGEAVGYVGKGSKAVGNGKNGERLIPLEIFVRGDKAPIYESTIEDEGRGGQATVLPFSSYGAMGWAREEYENNSGSSQFFWLLFDSDLTPAGKNVLDGRYPCFGYVVEGADFLTDIKEGDIITSAKVTKGLENLILPKE